MKKIFLILLLATISFIYAQSFTSYEDAMQSNASIYIKEIAHQIAMELDKSKSDDLIKSKTMVILSIVDIDNYKHTSDLSKRITENLISEMQKIGYRILDYKATNAIIMDNKGEYLFSRALKDLKKERKVTYALSGTYTRYRDSMTINCRIINIQSSIVVATASVSIPKAVLKHIEKRKQPANDWFASKR